MNCPTCQSELRDDQKYCPSCGANVAAMTLPPPPAGPVRFAPPEAPRPPAAPTAPIPAAVQPRVHSAAPDAFAIVEQTVPMAVDSEPAGIPEVAWDGGWSTPTTTDPNATGVQQRTGYQAQVDQRPVQNAGLSTTAVPYTPGLLAVSAPRVGRGSTVLAVVASIAGVAAIVSAFVPVLTVTTDAPIPEVGDYRLNDLFLGTNLVLAAVIAGVLLIGGGVLAVLGKRIGAGLAGGVGISLAAVAVVVWGRIDDVSQSAQANAVAVAAGGGGGTFFRAKQGVGLWVLIGAAAVGLVALIIALVQSGADGRPRLNVFVCVAGAAAAVVAAIGQMIPGDFTTFGDNFNTTLDSHAVVFGRLGMIAIVALAGIIGFLLASRWGVGLALGGAAIWIWQWISSITGNGDRPFPPGFVAFGTTDGKPHIVTTVGVIAMLVLAALAVLTAPKSHDPAAPQLAYG
jgi:hypothetical protein